MLEIILLYSLCKAIGNELRQKGRTPLGYQFLAVLFWFGGEILFAIGYLVATVDTSTGAGEDLGLMFYVVSLMGAALGAAVAYGIAASVPDATPRESESSALVYAE